MQLKKLPAAFAAAALTLVLITSTSAWSATKPTPPPPPPHGGSGPTPTSYVGKWSGVVTEGFVAPGMNSTFNGTLTITIGSNGSVSGFGPMGGVVSGTIDSSGNISYRVVTTVNGQTTTGVVSGTLSFVPGGLAGQLDGTFTNPNSPDSTNTVSVYVRLSPSN